MTRRLSIFVLVFAALLAVEPVLHRHSLQAMGRGTAGESTCAICVAGMARLPIAAASVAAPQTIAYTMVVPHVFIVSIDAPLPLPSRAPPAA